MLSVFYRKTGSSSCTDTYSFHHAYSVEAWKILLDFTIEWTKHMAVPCYGRELVGPPMAVRSRRRDQTVTNPNGRIGKVVHNPNGQTCWAGITKADFDRLNNWQSNAIRFATSYMSQSPLGCAGGTSGQMGGLLHHAELSTKIKFMLMALLNFMIHRHFHH